MSHYYPMSHYYQFHLRRLGYFLLALAFGLAYGLVGADQAHDEAIEARTEGHLPR